MLSSFGSNTFSLANTGQSVLGGSGNDTIVGGDGNDTIQAGQGVDNITGGAGNDVFVFASGDTGITSKTADTISDFSTGDKIKLNAVIDQFVFVDGSGFVFSTFSSNASTSFDGGQDVYAAYNGADAGNAWVAIDANSDGTFNSGDILLVLTGVSTSDALTAASFITS